ncbi:unnamed protein product, partial [Mesorhabditis spiculigera]
MLLLSFFLVSVSNADTISEYTMEILDNVTTVLNTGSVLYINGQPNITESVYEIRLGVGDDVGFRIQYQFIPANDSNPAQDVLIFGDDMRQDLDTDGIRKVMPRSAADSTNITGETHMIFIRVLDSNYAIYFTNGRSQWNIFNYQFTFPIQSVSSIGLRGEFLLKVYEHWNQSITLPHSFAFPTQDNIFPVGSTVVVVADLGTGTNFTIDLMGTGSTVNFRWQMAMAQHAYQISNNVSGDWSLVGTSGDCGLSNLAFAQDQIVFVIISNTKTSISVFVQIAGYTYNCPTYFVHNPLIDTNVGYHSVVVSGDVQPLQMCRINTLWAS